MKHVLVALVQDEPGLLARMGNLFARVIRRELEDGTCYRYNPRKKRSFAKTKTDA